MKKILLFTMLLASITLQAQTSYTVTNTNDAGAGSLRNVAAGIAAGDTIRFDPNIIAAGSDTITLTTGEIDFGNKGVIIKGLYNATDTMYISGNNNSRIFSFNGAGEVVLDSLVLINGNGGGFTQSGSGGAVFYIGGTDILHLMNSTIRGNTAYYGGGIYSYSYSSFSYSSITVNNSTVSGNTAAYYGGGIYSSSDYTSSSITVTNSTVSSNSANSGGGIYSYSFYSFSSVSAINSTVSSNSASTGGGIFSSSSSSSSSTIVTNSTVSGNTASSQGGGIYSTPMLTITSSIIAENGTGFSGIFPATITSNGYNIFSDAPSGSGGTDQTSITAVQLNLQALAFNGGSTQTMLPGAGSVAINMGAPSDMSDAQNRAVSEGRRDVGAAETVCATTAGVHNETVCFGGSIVVNGNTYDANTLTGTEVFTNIGSGNCDSTVTVALTIENTIDVTTATTNQTITANQAGATYRWLDCSNGNTVIAGATSANYTATTNGDYAVEITVGNCVDTSACVTVNTVGINENNFGDQIKLYPNPTSGVTTINLGAIKKVVITVMSITGKELYKVNQINESQVEVSLADYSKGIYFVKVQSNNQQKVVKLIKQ